MNLMNIKEIKNLSSVDINNKIIEIKREIFDLKFKQATRQSIKPHLFKAYKRMLAQLLTIRNNLKSSN
nr:50S ribosomal protein L29 [Corallina ferreyrae]YP_009660605.1 50S ribosomal protein L29 [Corallina chilensis]QBL75653.1 50S ribosomal protein L29 [Corallina ferreyrae]QCS25553.1 50S ribosomal protein L29 [Corallina chilensis]